MQPNIISKAVLTAFDNLTHYQINISSDAQLFQSISKDVIIVIDCSGSMGGKAMEQTKATLVKLTDFLLTSQTSNISFIKFNTMASIYFQIKKNAKDIPKIIAEIQASGGTNFSSALDAIHEIIQKYQNKIPFLSVIFLTDGKVNGLEIDNDFAILRKSISKLNIEIMNSVLNFEIHTLGLGSSHDPFLLESLIKIGGGQGTYQFIKDNNNINDCFENIIKVFDDSYCFQASLDFKTKMIPSIALKFQKLEGEKLKPNFESVGFLDIPLEKIEENDVLLTIKSPNETEIYFPMIKKVFKIDKIQTLKMSIFYLKNEILSIIPELLNQKKKSLEDYEKLANKFNSLKPKFNNTAQKIFRIPANERQPFFDSIGPLQSEYIPQIEKLLNAGFNNNITNELIANVQALSYRDHFKSRINKRVEKRVQINAKLINDVYENVAKYSLIVEKEPLMQKYKEIIFEIGSCILSCNNFIEAMLEKDCLCVTFNVTCNELCMVEPNKLIINEIFPSFISATSFLESVKYALKINPNSIGGFVQQENEKGKIVKGLAAEDINACLPIFLCPEHWKIAKLMMKPVLGWIMTLDPAGYDRTQLEIVPFKLLEKSYMVYLENPEKEFPKKVFSLILQTCENILLDEDNLELLQKLKERWMLYLENGDIRCENVSNNAVFLLQVYCALRTGLIKEEEMKNFDQIFNKLCEEELRRNQQKIDKNELASLLKQGLNISNEQIVNYGEKAMILLKEKKENQEKSKSNEEEEKKSNDNPILIPQEKLMKIEEIYVEGKLSQLQEKYYQNQFEIFKKECKKLFQIRKLFKKDDLELDFSSIGIKNDIQFLACSLQNQIQVKNSSRSSAIKLSNYKNCEKIEEAIEFLESLASKTIEQESDKIYKFKYFAFKENLLVKEEKPFTFHQTSWDHSNEKKLEILLSTNDIFEAIQLFQEIGIMKRKPYVNYFYKLSGNFIVEKLEFFMLGEYLGKTIIKEWQSRFFLKKDVLNSLVYYKKISEKKWEEIVLLKKEQRKRYHLEGNVIKKN